VVPSAFDLDLAISVFLAVVTYVVQWWSTELGRDSPYYAKWVTMQIGCNET
jgi:hypothetical protein